MSASAHGQPAKEHKQPGSVPVLSERVFHFAIPRKQLTLALIELADVADSTLVFPAMNISDLDSQPVMGELTLKQALEIMLQGTDLDAEVLASGQIKIFAKVIPVAQSSTATAINEEVVVTGLSSSIKLSAAIKHEATQIIEVVTEEEIGKMPDKSVGEVLQRLPGVQVEQQSGFGNNIRVRGLSQNLILFNGEAVLTGMELLSYKDEYIEGSFENIPVDLLSQIKVYKTPLASQVEGSIGGAINLITRHPSDFDEPVWITQIKTDYGEYSQEASPTIDMIMANQWSEKFSTVVSLFAGKQVFTQEEMDFSAENQGFGIILDNGDGEEGEVNPYILPHAYSVGTLERDMERFGGIFNIEYQMSQNNRLQLDILANNIKSVNEGVLIKHDPTFSYSPEFELNQTNALGFIERGRFGDIWWAESQAEAENNDIQALNAIVTLDSQLTENITMQATVLAANAVSKQRMATAVALYGNAFGFQWVGNEGEDGTETGWQSGILLPGTLGEFAFEFDRYNEPHLAYDKADLLTNTDTGFFGNQWADGLDVNQQQRIARLDFDYALDAFSLTNIRWGARYAEKHTVNDVKYYLTDFGRSAGLAHPARLDSEGNVVQASNFDPSRPPDPEDFNAAIQLPVFYDLCGNGGIPAGNTCDINGDGEDDNIPLGTHFYQIGWLQNTVAPVYQFLSLYGFDDFAFEGLPYLPMRTFADEPKRVRRIDRISHNWDYQRGILLPNVGLMSEDVGEWIAGIAPNAPTELMKSPTRS